MQECITEASALGHRGIEGKGTADPLPAPFAGRGGWEIQLSRLSMTMA